jgi:hypothetical protein
VSEGFEGQGLDKRAAKQLVAAHVLRGTWVSGPSRAPRSRSRPTPPGPWWT